MSNTTRKHKKNPKPVQFTYAPTCTPYNIAMLLLAKEAKKKVVETYKKVLAAGVGSMTDAYRHWRKACVLGIQAENEAFLTQGVEFPLPRERALKRIEQLIKDINDCCKKCRAEITRLTKLTKQGKGVWVTL